MDRNEPFVVGAAIVFGALGLVVLAACDDAGAQRADEPRPAATQTENVPSAVALHMMGRYAVVTEIRDALVRGDLREASRAAEDLARPVRLEGLPAEANAHVIGVHLRAQEVAQAESLLDASAAFASLMTSCAECHAASGVRLSTPTAPLPTPGARAGGPMRRHAEAVDAMWKGLLVGSTGGFDAGARQLVAAPLTGPEERQPAELRRLADQARSHARAATTAPGLSGRAEQFGLLLSTCAECHATARR